MAFGISNAMLTTSPISESGDSLTNPGSPVISANGTSNAILWALDDASGVLHAYDATNLSTELYTSQQAGTVDKFVTPTVANGRVYVATTTGVAVFGLLQ